jgi:hypothetical protein
MVACFHLYTPQVQWPNGSNYDQAGRGHKAIKGCKI